MLQHHNCNAVKVHPAAKLKDETYERHLWDFHILRNLLESALRNSLAFDPVGQPLLRTYREATAQALPFVQTSSQRLLISKSNALKWNSCKTSLGQLIEETQLSKARTQGCTDSKSKAYLPMGGARTISPLAPAINGDYLHPGFHPKWNSLCRMHCFCTCEWRNAKTNLKCRFLAETIFNANHRFIHRYCCHVHWNPTHATTKHYQIPAECQKK